MADEVPVVTVQTDQGFERLKKLTEKFKEKFDCEPNFYGRAPGRVNLIGEHIDYCGYSVLPMAIEQDVVIAVATTESQDVLLTNMKSELYNDFVFTVNNVNINKDKPQWQDYFQCGFLGMTEHLKLSSPPRGMKCMVDGTVPPSSGLSSSSALVCCAALVTMYANGKSLPKKELADMCAKCERYIGTQGGGMDQAISFMAHKGTAKLIDFNPLKATDVYLPDGISFVISNSCVEKNKASSSEFNTRVVECRIATQILAKQKGLQWADFQRLGDVQKALNISLPQAVKLVKEVLHKEPYTRSEICQILDMKEEDFVSNILSARTAQVQSFKLFQRATHVFSEAGRVLSFKHICEEADPQASQKLGKLMNESHTSCRDMYECSCTDLDNLVNICLEAGALGSRLTGAGWGGCAVSMVPTNHVMDFLVKVKKNFYDKNPSKASMVGKSLFATQPGSGAQIYLPNIA
ncbi:N-acetylgalactosamine kinase-like isoform X1 [Saccostrea cucullata]|uniref:N-acetylgalactosamine kinase-like isoform X1 n=1 Tax=Saccostrea cuccullata TaxID=36930 RepID=UPI002ED64ECF